MPPNDEPGTRPGPAPARPRWRSPAVPVEALVLLLIVAAGANVRFDLADRLGVPAVDPVTAPGDVAPPPGLDLAQAAAAPAVGTAAVPVPVDEAAVADAVRPHLHAVPLGDHVVVRVADLRTGEVLFSSGDGPVTPASTIKLLTGAAALEALGPDARFRTTTRLHGDRVVLVGGGDPYLSSTREKAHGLYPERADLDTLASRTANALSRRGLDSVRLRYDASLFTGPALAPTWQPGYADEDVVPPITALWADRGRVDGHYADDPARAAALAFARALERQGITVRGKVRPGDGTAAVEEIAGVDSAPLAEIVEHLVAVSDNNAAEVVAHHLGRARGEEASFAGGARAVLDVAADLGIDLSGADIHDGSGLSRADRISPETLLDVLRIASDPDRPELRAVVTGLPVSGFTGSLRKRFAKGPVQALGRVRAKTGTLVEGGVHGLAGIVTTVDGAELSFVAVADDVSAADALAARAALDRLAAALGACTCAGQPGLT